MAEQEKCSNETSRLESAVESSGTYSHRLEVKKVFTFHKSEAPILSACTSFESPIWKEFESLKQGLNEVKSHLNCFDINEWDSHTQKTNRAGAIPSTIRRLYKPELCTQAWAKFHEILSVFPDLIQLSESENQVWKSMHLCEAPGAFIAALNHHLVMRGALRDPELWHWRANTLNPYYEGHSRNDMIPTDTLIAPTISHWCFGADSTGDITSLANIKAIVKADVGKVDLVTADGSVNIQNNPGEQETMVALIHIGEVITALQLLKPGGSLIVKLFTFFEAHTISLLYLLHHCFQKMTAFKPFTSKPGNSEVYFILQCFHPISNLQSHLNILQKGLACSQRNLSFHKQEIPQSFLDEVMKAAVYFKSCQEAAITENISLFECKDKETLYQYIAEEAQETAQHFLEMYPLKRIPESARLSHQSRAHQDRSSRFLFCGSYEERVGQKSLEDRKAQLKSCIMEFRQSLQSTWRDFPVLHPMPSGFHFDQDLVWLLDQVMREHGRPIPAVRSSVFFDNNILEKSKEIYHLMGEVQDLGFIRETLQELNDLNENVKDEGSNDMQDPDSECHAILINLKTEMRLNEEARKTILLDLLITVLSDEESLNQLSDTDRPSPLRVQGMHLLHRFNMSLLLLLAAVFNTVSFMWDCQIQFEMLRVDKKVISGTLVPFLEDLLNDLERGHRSDPPVSILSLFPIDTLTQDQKICSYIPAFNGRILWEFLCAHIHHTSGTQDAQSQQDLNLPF